MIKKILLSIVPFSVLAFVFLDLFVIDFIEIDIYNKIWNIIFVSNLVFYVFLFFIIWKNEKDVISKFKQIGLSLIFYPYVLYYIWKSNNC